METKKASLSIRVIYWVTNVLFWVLIIASTIFIIDAVLFYSGVKTSSGMVGETFPAEILVKKTSHFVMNNQTIKLEMVGTTESIVFSNPPDFISKQIAPLFLLKILALTYLLWFFRKFIKNVKRGEIFTIKNITLLKRISYVLAGYWIVLFVSSQIASYYITGPLNFSKIYLDFILTGHLLWDALFIWVLAHIFITGLKLKQEKDLTI